MSNAKKSKKVRVYELSKEIGMSNSKVVELLKELEVELGVKQPHMSVLPDNVVTAFRNRYLKDKPKEPEDKKPEAKVEAKPETSDKPKQIVEKQQLNKPLTPNEAALAARIQGVDDDWKIITEEDLGDFSLSEDAYKLHKEALEMQENHEFAFRFIESTPQRVDEITSLSPPLRWWIVNATNMPRMAKYCDPNHGGVQKLDQIMVFKPWWMHQAHKDAIAGISKVKKDAGDIELRDGATELNGKVKFYAGKNPESKDSHFVGGQGDSIIPFEGESSEVQPDADMDMAGVG